MLQLLRASCHRERPVGFSYKSHRHVKAQAGLGIARAWAGDSAGPEPGKEIDAPPTQGFDLSQLGEFREEFAGGRAGLESWRAHRRREGGTQPASLTQFPFPTSRHPDRR